MIESFLLISSTQILRVPTTNIKRNSGAGVCVCVHACVCVHVCMHKCMCMRACVCVAWGGMYVFCDMSLSLSCSPLTVWLYILFSNRL